MKLTIKKRLFLGFGLLFVVIESLGIFAMAQLNAVNQKATEIAGNWLPRVEVASELNTLTYDFRIKELKYPQF